MNHGLYDNPASEGLILLAKINTIKKKIITFLNISFLQVNKATFCTLKTQNY